MITSNEPSTSPSLLSAAKHRNPEAWRRFVYLYSPVIYRWIRRRGLQPSDAADVTQDVLLSVSKDLEAFDIRHPESSFRGWLWRITSRRIADAARRLPQEMNAGSKIEGIADANGTDQPPTDMSLDRDTLLARAIALYRDRFDEKTWQAFWLTVVENRDPGQVADELGVSRWNVYKARARMLQRLRSELEGLID